MRIEDGAIHMLRNADTTSKHGLSTESTGIITGRNSGYQAINIAVLAGARRIVLLGYDMKHKDGLDHFKGGAHPIPTPEAHLKSYAPKFRTMVEPLQKLGVEVLNATPDSAIDAFPKVTLTQAL